MTRNLLITATALALLTSGAHAAGSGSSQSSANTGAATGNTATGSTAATASTTQANADVMETCAADLNRVNESIGMGPFGTRGRDIRTLHEAAMIFAQNGQAEACRRVAEGLQAYMETASTQATERTGAQFKERVKNARPLDEIRGTIRASELIGADVVSTNGNTLGDVDDVVMSPTDDTRYLLVGTGGFLELGEEYVPVKSDEIRVIDRNTLVLDVKETAFQDAPRFDMDTIEQQAEQWSNQIASWWDENVTQQAE